MPRSKHLLAVGLTTFLLVAGGGTALAFGPLGDRDGFLSGLAERLGVEQSELEDAIRDTRADQIDQAEADGRLSEEQADAMRERLGSGEGPLFGPGGPQGFHRGHHGPGELLEPAAEALGLTAEELRERLPGSSLAAIAEEENVETSAVVDAIVKARRQAIADAVDAGRLTEQQADAAREGLRARVTEMVQRKLPEPSEFGPGRHGPHHGPWGDEDRDGSRS